MKTKRLRQRMTLNKRTVVNLNKSEMNQVSGGRIVNTDTCLSKTNPSCVSRDVSCQSLHEYCEFTDTCF
jgi:hypothetical protein